MTCFRDVIPDFEEAGAQVLGVSIDSFAVQGAFARETEAKFPLLSDWPQYKAGKAYDVYEEGRPVFKRVTYVIDKDGIIRGVVESETDMDIHAREALRIVKEELAG